MADYRPDHLEALQEMQRDGAPVLFGTDSPGTYDPRAGSWSGAQKNTVAGFAIEVPGDPEEYARLGLTRVTPLTLQFVPTIYNTVPKEDHTTVWGGRTYTVKQIRPIRPAGEVIAARVILS